MCIVNGSEMTIAQFNDMIRIVARQGDIDMAVKFLHETTGFWCSEMSSCVGGGIEKGEAADQMIGVILDHFWRVYNGGSKY